MEALFEINGAAMPYTKELQDALKMVEHLPEKYQKRCAYDLRLWVIHHEEETTMTQKERDELQRLREVRLRARFRKK